MNQAQSNIGSSERIKVLVFGAGAIGAYVGGSLALAGHGVIFVERPEVAEEIRQRGLRLNLNGKNHIIYAPQVVGALADALQAGAFDAALFALKSFDTQAALQSLIPYREALPPLLCLQNGVENEPTIEAALGPGKVIAGTVTSVVERRGVGDVVLEKARGIGLAGESSQSRRLAMALEAAGIKTRLYPRAADMKWSKMLANLLANASSAILGMTPAEIFAHPGLYRLEITQLREALAVMAALGIRAVNLPGVPVGLLALSIRLLPSALSRPLLQRAVGRGRGNKMPSFHIDLHSGRGVSEVDYLNGAVVRAADKLNLTAPVNRKLNETLLAMTRKEIPLEEFTSQPEKLIRLCSI